jgi:hypothetical protein
MDRFSQELADGRLLQIKWDGQHLFVVNGMKINNTYDRVSINSRQFILRDWGF